MVVCPYDCHWCDLSACRAGGCEITGEQPLRACSGCGVLVVRTVGFGICVECMTVEVRALVQEGQYARRSKAASKKPALHMLSNAQGWHPRAAKRKRA